MHDKYEKGLRKESVMGFEYAVVVIPDGGSGMSR